MAYVVSVTEKDQEKQNRSIRNAHERLTTAEAAIDAVEAEVDALQAVTHREVLTADRSYYVLKTGSDSNDGLANTAGGAFLTIQKAIDAAAALDSSIYNVGINVGDGTYSQALTLKRMAGAGAITITGNTTTPANVVIAAGGSIAINGSNTLTRYNITGVRITGTSFGIFASGSTTIQPGIVNLATTGAAQVYADNGAFVAFANNYTISSGAGRHLWAYAGGYIQCVSRTITVSGTPAFSSAFAVCQTGGLVLASGNTYSGSATGTRFAVSDLGVIDTGGGGANYFPGNAAGTGTNPSASPYGLYK
jgi:hypothetical protein